MLNEETLTYIISFLVGNTIPKGIVGYTSNTSDFERYKVVIFPSAFFQPHVFGTMASMPQFPLQQIDGTNLLFGTSQIEKRGNTLIVHADIIASTFFLISRYEETINTNRDVHGRFRGKDSVLYKAQCIHLPIVEQYGVLLRKWLREAGCEIAEPTPAFSKIYLTHDVDKVSQFRNLRGFCGGWLRAFKHLSFSELQMVLKSVFCGVEYDPLFTFPWLFTLDKQVKQAEIIAFFKSGISSLQFDKPNYDLYQKEVQQLIAFCKQNNVQIGLHASYLSGENPLLIAQTKRHLEEAIAEKVIYNRHHYLRSCEPQDMQALTDTGITDDFTMGYADMAGFRLGTCRAVQWINPYTQKLTKLILHPLTIMDCSLSEPHYMGMNYEDALEYCQDIIAQVKKYNGELVLLWHNTSVAEYAEYKDMYHKTLYERLITDLT